MNYVKGLVLILALFLVGGCFKNDNAKLTKEMEQVVINYYEKNLKTNNVTTNRYAVTLNDVEFAGGDIKMFLDHNCSKDSYGLITFERDASGNILNDKYEVEIFLDCPSK